MLWFLLALGSALLWAITNLIDATLLEQEQQTPATLTTITGLFASLPLVLLPFSQSTSFSFILLAIVSGMLALFVYWPYFRAMQQTHTANVILLWNLSPILVAIGAWWLFHESWSIREYFGIGFLIVSSLFAGYDPHAKSKFSWQAIAWMILASITLAIECLLFEYLFSHLSWLTGVAWIAVGNLIAACLMLILVQSVRSQIKEALLKRRLQSRIVLNEGLDVVANLSRVFAITIGPVSLVTAIGGLQPLFVLLLAPFFPTRHRIPSRVLVIGSIVFGVIGLGLIAQTF